MSSSQYYPEKKLDSISAQNQPYPSHKYYPYPEPKNTFRLNPLVISSLKNIDVDDLQRAFGKGIQEKREFQRGQKISNTKLFNENEEIKKIRDSIEQAKLNQFRAHQIHQNQVKRVQNLIKDTEADEVVLKNLEEEKRRINEEEERKKQERLRAKYLIQQQMKDKEFLKEEAKKEYEKDKVDVDNMINKIKQEDIAAREEAERKMNIQKIYMENAYAEKAKQKQKEKEEDLLQKEKERKYQEEIAKREEELNNKKAAIEKDKIFEQLCEQEAKRQAERDYWENVRNELYIEQNEQKQKLKELEEKEKLQRQKEELLASAIEQMKYKKQRKKEEQEMEAEFKKKLMEQYAEDEKLEQYNMRRRKQRELDLKQEVERQWQLKLAQYQKQKEQELEELELAKKKEKKEEHERYLIEQEKQRLIKENETLLKAYYPTGYHKAISSMRPTTAPVHGRNKQFIYNNIFGNSNPNPPEAYPKYGNIKNFVYDKSIQEVNHNINMDNYYMYDAYKNNDYDSYPKPSQMKQMERNRIQTKNSNKMNTGNYNYNREKIPTYA